MKSTTSPWFSTPSEPSPPRAPRPPLDRRRSRRNRRRWRPRCGGRPASAAASWWVDPVAPAAWDQLLRLAVWKEGFFGKFWKMLGWWNGFEGVESWNLGDGEISSLKVAVVSWLNSDSDWDGVLLNTLSGVGSGILQPAEVGRSTAYSSERTHPINSYTLQNDGHMWFCDKLHPKSDCLSQKGFSAEKERKRRWWTAKLYQCLQPEKDKNKSTNCAQGEKKHMLCALEQKRSWKTSRSWATTKIRNRHHPLNPLRSSSQQHLGQSLSIELLQDILQAQALLLCP